MQVILNYFFWLIRGMRWRSRSEGRGFDSGWGWIEFFIDFRPHYDPGVYLAFNRNVYQEYFLGGKEGRCIWLTTLPPSYADCLEIWEPQLPGTLRACPGPEWDCFTFMLEFRLLSLILIIKLCWTGYSKYTISVSQQNIALLSLHILPVRTKEKSLI